MKKYHVTIDDVTGGTIIAEKVVIGDKVTVQITDENGRSSEATGIVTSIDFEEELWG